MEDYCKYQQRLMGTFSPKVAEKHFTDDIINQIFSILGLRQFWRKTYYGLTLQVSQLRRQGKPLEALNVLVHGLTHGNFWRDHSSKWWSLMKTAVGIAQDLKLGGFNRFEPTQQLLKLSRVAPQPWQGYDVAYSFVALSLWSFSQGKTQRAIEHAQIAIHADPSWGYPEYLFGWYGLILEGIDSVPHFVRAIKADRRYFQRLKQDPLLQQFPDILQSVKQKVLIPK